ncbi:unnamed protein product [Dibothriocephalus latus]|uniref:glucose-6-phosphate dehydrogenase (NADP(+)) n=1 Tax=Dibothriocephalus latus TaxID=60516 RepID=A0A3P7QF31_DIBLA|nr:unnamed protein product [Dibothriocephalus latus]
MKGQALIATAVSCKHANFTVRSEKAAEKERFEEFWKFNAYLRGSYTQTVDFAKLDKLIVSTCGQFVNRIFYLALPPSTYSSVATHLAANCLTKK